MFYLQTLLLEDELYREKYKTYSVDCEYNRINEDKIRKIFPDIIFHKRKEEGNLIVIEMKKSTLNDEKCKEKDKIRLKIMTNPNDLNNFKYTLGVYFEVDTTGNNNHIIEFFVDGKEYKKA